MQIGNIHIGKASNAEASVIDSSEAYSLFNALTLRYDLVQLMQIYHNFAHDPDFKELIKQGMSTMLDEQIKCIEEQMAIFKMVMPKRAPKNVNIDSDSTIFTDELMFRHSYIGMQYFIENDVRAAVRSITNDAVRDMFMDFVHFELKHFGNLVKYGKVKGWFESPPIYPST
ncbi:hypothetical protein ASZ90_018511 [hydrocarbon metagenome]|uniref:Rubrerythrin diiron-binding domain-containing protein n=1 Tax=hydrocarbon metagenome TaxID=938273 RepID=A0A0W8E6M2_9ZZZZ